MTRGGKLTIVNGLLWLGVAVGVATDTPPLLWPALVVCWPVAWLFLLPLFGRISMVGPELPVACLMIGVNSFLWGYGLSWVVSLFATFAGTGQPPPATHTTRE